jgi:hypothetical protein
MTTAEKRAALEAAGEPWPDCPCHGQPCLWQKDFALTAKGRFYCRIRNRETLNRNRDLRRQRGVCVYCGGPKVTESMCQECSDSHADVMAGPEQRLAHQFSNIRHRRRRRADEGFRSTGAGLAAFAAWTGKELGHGEV